MNRQNIEYKLITIPKRNGKKRIIEQPLGKGMTILRDRLIHLESIKELRPSYFTHSFVKNKNIVTCARQHENKKIVIRIDIKDFFPSITYGKFKTVMKQTLTNRYKQETYSMTPHNAALFIEGKLKKIMKAIAICFKPDEKHFDDEDKNYLPQGSPTSPFLSNSFMWLFDWKTAWFCYDRGITYNRYADDIFLSTNKIDTNTLRQIFAFINKYLKRIGLKENVKKRQIMKHGKRMMVLGIILNQGNFKIPKEKRRIIRAIKHNAKKENRALTPQEQGIINFGEMVENYEKRKDDNLKLCEKIKITSKI